MLFEVAYFIDALLAMCLPYVQSDYMNHVLACAILINAFTHICFSCVQLSTHMEDFHSLEEDDQSWRFSEISILHNDVCDVFPASSACMARCNTRSFNLLHKSYIIILFNKHINNNIFRRMK